MKAVIMAGGEGTRLRPLTRNTPKPLVPVVRRRCIDYSLQSMARAGVTEIIVTTSTAVRPRNRRALVAAACYRRIGSRRRWVLAREDQEVEQLAVATAVERDVERRDLKARWCRTTIDGQLDRELLSTVRL